MACTPPSNASIPRRADATLVAFESLTYSTPPALPTSSRRCGTPAKPRRAAATASPGTPATRATADAPMAFSRLCRPRRRISEAGSGSSSGSPNVTRRARPGREKPGGATATCSGVWLRNMPSLASRYASKLPWRSRWSSSTFRSRPTSGAKASLSSAWKLETSQTTVVSGSTSPTSADSGVPTLPATATGSRAARQIAPSSSTVVVLPFVPVTATKRFGSSRQASSSSPSTGTPRARAAWISGASWGTPGLFTTSPARSSKPTPSLSSSASRSSGSSGRPESQASTSPCARSIRAAAIPERASPTTRYGPSGRTGLTA